LYWLQVQVNSLSLAPAGISSASSDPSGGCSPQSSPLLSGTMNEMEATHTGVSPSRCPQSFVAVLGTADTF
jgi:hypothetical protein